jgi:hypothetical protein
MTQGSNASPAGDGTMCAHGSECVELMRPTEGEGHMLWTIFLILMIMWLMGVVTSYTLGGFIHVLLLLAIASVLIRVIQGQRPV